MASERVKSIVPMFGGATHYVETLDLILDYVDEHHPTSDELVGWHQGAFEQVSSRDSILRRVRYLANVGFLAHDDDIWMLGPKGERYFADRSTDTLLEIMCRRNLGLRSLLYALSVRPMSIDEISHQQLDTHPELGWDLSNPDMALQRVNWLRSLGLVEKTGDQYSLTDMGREYTDDAVEVWAKTDTPGDRSMADVMSAGTYETKVQARSVDPEFRATVLYTFDRTCAVSDVDHPNLLDVAHILSWSEYPTHRADLRNVLPLSKLHHAAFDCGFFTLDEEYHIRVNPAFETESAVLEQTIVEQAGRQVSLPEDAVAREYLHEHNASFEWV